MVHWRRPSGLQSGRMYRKLHASVYRKRSMSKVFRERRSQDIRYPQTKHRILQQDAPLQALCGAREADGPAWRWGVMQKFQARATRHKLHTCAEIWERQVPMAWKLDQCTSFIVFPIEFRDIFRVMVTPAVWAGFENLKDSHLNR